MDNIHSFSKRYYLSLNEDLNVNWDSSGLPLEKEIDINGEKIKPYEVAVDVVDSWLESVKEAFAKNIEKSQDGAIFKAAFNRIAKKTFPSLIGYLIPQISFGDKNVIENKKATPESFWSEAWPKVWDEFSAIERGLIQKFTVLNKDTQYKDVMKGLGEALSDNSSYSFYKEEIGNQVKLLYDMIGKTFSEMFDNKPVSLSNDLIIDLGKDLNDNIQGSKIDFEIGKKEDVKGEISDIPVNDLPPSSRKTFGSIVKDIENFTSKAFNADAAKGNNEVKNNGDKPEKSSTTSMPSPEVQSVRKWAEKLDPVTKRIVIDTIRSTGMS